VEQKMSSQPHIFWGKTAPLAALCGGGLLVMASVRLAYALVTAVALLWVYGLSVLIFQAAARFFPRMGKTLCQTFLASLTGSLFLLLLWFLSPLAALEIFFIVSLVPLFCIASGIFSRLESLDISDAVARAFEEAVVWGVLIVLFAVIREPLGFLSLSLPGGAQGIIYIFSFEKESFLPIRVIASSSGALLLLGYGLGLYRYFRNINAPREKDI
jgi:hypothetical protein